MTVETMTLGSYQTNCYLVHDGCACAIVDPGYNAPAILRRVQQLGLKVDAILLTHGHFDHVGAVEQIVEKTGCALWMSESDWSQKISPLTGYFYPLANCDFTEVHFCEDGEIIHAGGLTFEVLITPGHTCGSVCYRCGNALFTGDTLFAGSCGRTDLPGGDGQTLAWSLERLWELEEDFRIYPGHGEPSTLSQEKSTNPYLRAAAGL